MKANYFKLDGAKSKQLELPEQFNEELRPDLIQKAVLVIQSHKRQPYGANPEAGQRASAVLSRRRRKYRGSYGHGISRVPRKVTWKRGTQFGFVGAFAPGTVKGRRAHPPKAQKIWDLKMNIKEKRKAIRSALSAAVNKKLVLERGHKFKELPTIVENKIEDLKKTKEIENILKKLGLQDELKRISKRKVRAGKGKMRGRKYRIKKGPLFVVSKDCPLIKTIQNLQGCDICQVQNVNTELLAPGALPGRLTIFSEDAISRLEKEKLFTQNYKAPKKETKK